MRHTLEDIIQCLDREVKLRKRLYPGRVARKRMTKAAADREIAVMQQILDEYVAAMVVMQSPEGPDLFAEADRIFGERVPPILKRG